MIPVKLQMCNFLSYGENSPVLDFTRFNIACLSGKNGQGKSALLDALTWSIWGEGRKASDEKKADSGLLKIGTDYMWVDLTFDLEGERYRIIRKYTKMKKKSRTELEFQVFDEEKSLYVSLSSPSIRQTQQKINHLLRMDYETFINSAFILQGRVDEFTRKSARERKQILSELLGLSHYEALSVLARKHLRQAEDRIISVNSRISQLQKEIRQKELLQKELQEVQLAEKKINRKLDKAKETLQELEKNQGKLIYDRENKKELIRRINVERKELQDYEKRKSETEKNIREYRLLISREKEINSVYKDYLALNNENQRMMQQMQLYRSMEKAKREIEQKIEQKKNQLLLQLEQKKQKYSELQKKAIILNDELKEKERLEYKIKQLDSLVQQQEKIQDEGNHLNIVIETKNTQVNTLKKQIQQNQGKIDLLGQKKQEYCPLCNSPLDEQKTERIRSNFKKEIEKNILVIKKIDGDINNLKNKKKNLQQEWKKINNEVLQREKIQSNLTTCLLQIKEAEKAKQQAGELKQKIDSLKNQIQQKNFALNERTHLAEIERKIQKQEYNDEKYIEINRKLNNLKDIPLKKEKLMEAEKSIGNLDNELERINQQIKSKRNSVDKITKERDDISQRIKELPELEKTIDIQKRLLHSLQKEQADLYQRRGAYQGKLDQIACYLEEQKTLEKQCELISEQKKIYQKLNLAFSKNGIQSMIIENAIPELEEEANSILSRLSDAGTMINFESLKDLKNGGVKETLDIRIHDEMGVRPYELYSGGETFRIDFAIRIALSKLLTYRAGARLRTLVIDEGFGTQDEDGLQKLIQAIQAIQNDFDKILVITHLPMLKDAFPVRIEVWKDPVIGSQFELIHL